MGSHPSGDHQRARAAAVSRAVICRATEAGVHLPGDLLIWELAGEPGLPGDDVPGPHGHAPADGAGGLEGLPAVLEAATPPMQRRVNGLHVTPSDLASALVDLALDAWAGSSPPQAVCDPACGGGAFLLAAARHLHERGLSKREVVERCLWGADIDPVGLATAEAALALWSGAKPPDGRLVVGDALLASSELWPEVPEGGFDAVVGNPPFLSQLAASTARTAAQRQAVRRRFGAAARPYTDTAWLFLLAGKELLRPGGRLALLQPTSIVGARDAGVVRDELGRGASLRHLWVGEEQTFAASVKVCCPILEVDPCPGERVSEPGESWADRFADSTGVPRISAPVRERLGDRADVGAGFRGEYYGLASLVREAAAGEPDSVPGGLVRPLVTAGALDWARSSWGERPIRFARRRWSRPVVDATGLPPDPRRGTPEGKGAAWLARTERPKVLVANQTRVLEPVVDASGTWVPSVPVIAVMPEDPEDVWRLGAALASPVATAWLLRRAPGTALGHGAMKVAAGDVAGLPLPVDRHAWEMAAGLFRSLVEGGSAVAGSGSVLAAGGEVLDAYCRTIALAYGAPDGIESWWRDRWRQNGRR